MAKVINNDYAIIGAAGEFLVAAEISKRGAIATLTLKNSPDIDILATNPKTGAFANIQVKTRSVTNNQGWLLNSKVERTSTVKAHFYVFVNLKHDELADFYIIPFNVFARYATKKHLIWLKTNDRHGQKRKDNSIRNFKPATQDFAFGKKYLSRWELLGLF